MLYCTMREQHWFWHKKGKSYCINILIYVSSPRSTPWGTSFTSTPATSIQTWPWRRGTTWPSRGSRQLTPSSAYRKRGRTSTSQRLPPSSSCSSSSPQSETQLWCFDEICFLFFPELWDAAVAAVVTVAEVAVAASVFSTLTFRLLLVLVFLSVSSYFIYFEFINFRLFPLSFQTAPHPPPWLLRSPGGFAPQRACTPFGLRSKHGKVWVDNALPNGLQVNWRNGTNFSFHKCFTIFFLKNWIG